VETPPMRFNATNGRRDDWKAERERIDLAAVVTNLLGPAVKREGRRLLWRCPFHDDHNPSFVVDPARKSWRCFPCGIGGDAAALVMRHEGLMFPEAIAFLTSRPNAERKAPARPAKPPVSDHPAEPSGLPVADALALVDAAAARLWSPEGSDAIAYLTRCRCLSPETIRRARLGWCPDATLPKADGTGFRALGVVIPWFASGRLALVKIRHPDGRRPKYAEAFRDPSRLVCYPGPETIRPGWPLVVAEGEFDALALGEDLAELAAVVTLGSASARPEPAVFGRMLAASPWFIATDGDTAGDKSAAGWPARARRVRPPEPFKDWTEVKAAGVDLRRWWADVLSGIDRPALFTWPELSSSRWGPGLDDLTPGIDIGGAPKPPRANRSGDNRNPERRCVLTS
jgi:hypothetical protein